MPWEEFFRDFCSEYGQQYCGQPEADWPGGRAVSADQESLFKMYLDTDMSNSIDFGELAVFVNKDVGLYGSFLSLVGSPDMSSTPIGLWKIGIKEAQSKTQPPKPVVKFSKARKLSRQGSMKCYQDKFKSSSEGKETMNSTQFQQAFSGSDVRNGCAPPLYLPFSLLRSVRAH